MKKFLSIFLVLVMALSLVSCASKEVKQYVEANQSQVEATLNATSGVFENIVFEARGNSVAYKYTYAEKDMDADFVELLKESLDSTSDAMQDVLTQMRDECPDIESMIYEYYDGNGKLLISREYK